MDYGVEVDVWSKINGKLGKREIGTLWPTPC